MSSVIEIQNLSKSYKNASIKSLDDISFVVNKEDKIGIFGPNGAGKTTLMSIICGIIKPTSGKSTFKSDTEEIEHKKQLFKLGYVPQDFAFYPELSPYQNLMYFGTLYEIPKKQLKVRITELLSVLGLGHVMHDNVKTFSGGMKRRVNLAIGIIHSPELLFLDEPTVGVDVQSKHAIMTYLEELNQSGTTIIYTSHHLNEAQEFCDRIIFLDQGKLISDSTLNQLLSDNEGDDLQALFLKLTGTAYRD